ncbi:hypothetical protein L218DRAFT_1006153 [Marasmius fiardii PR-910]|nr:hypothetical protein L218DRAFT_1006153 [Marasmius fiardii PR-910]
MSNSQDQQSVPLTDEDIVSLKEAIVDIAVGFILYGVYTTLSIITVYSFLARGLRNSKARLILFIITVFMFLISTCSLVLNLQYYLILLPMFSPNPPDLNILGSLLSKISIAFNMFDRTNYIISDGIVVWRAWVFYHHTFFVKLVLSICMLASAIGTLTDIIVAIIRRHRNSNDPGSPINILAMTVPLLVTNTVATLFIAYKVWCYRRALQHNLGHSSSSFTKVQKVINLLVESGFVYCILWMIYTLVTVATGFQSPSWQAYSRALPVISAIYPVLIILLVSLENSNVEANGEMSLSQSMRFASAPSNTEGGNISRIDIESQTLGQRQASIHVIDGEGIMYAEK